MGRGRQENLCRSFYALRLDGDATRQWQKLPTWPGPARIYHAMAASEAGVYIVSGNAVTATPEGKQRRIFLLDVFRYLPGRAGRAGKGWTALPSLVDPVAAASVYVEKGRLIVFGGDTGFYAPHDAELRERHPGFPKVVIAYDAMTRQWQKIGDFPTSLVTTGIVKWGDELVIAGGEDRPGHRSVMVLAVRLKRLNQPE